MLKMFKRLSAILEMWQTSACKHLRMVSRFSLEIQAWELPVMWKPVLYRDRWGWRSQVSSRVKTVLSISWAHMSLDEDRHRVWMKQNQLSSNVCGLFLRFYQREEIHSRWFRILSITKENTRFSVKGLRKSHWDVQGPGSCIGCTVTT